MSLATVYSAGHMTLNSEVSQTRTNLVGHEAVTDVEALVDIKLKSGDLQHCRDEWKIALNGMWAYISTISLHRSCSCPWHRHEAVWTFTR